MEQVPSIWINISTAKLITLSINMSLSCTWQVHGQQLILKKNKIIENIEYNFII